MITLDAALIAGGKSSRFGEGVDKAFLEWKGQALYAHQLGKLLRLNSVKQVYLSKNSEQSFPPYLDGVIQVEDQLPNQGPVEALRRIFEASEADYLLMVAVDLPTLEISFLENLVGSANLEQCGIVYTNNNHYEPLLAIYPRAQMLELLNQHPGEQKLQKICAIAEKDGLLKRQSMTDEIKRNFVNINSANDLESIQQGILDESTLLSRFHQDRGWEREVSDAVAIEEPLELRVNGQSVAVMMRTPGHDDELAVGFLISEGVLHSSDDEILEIAHCPDVDPEGMGNTLDVRLRDAPDLDALTRHVFTSSSCGVCGKATIDSVFQECAPISETLRVPPEVLFQLPRSLRRRQKTFDRTGGLHASALFTEKGELLLAREDVGRHNALDKVIGRSFLDKQDLSRSILLVSGRVSFELMQKALVARIPFVAGISAPSSLAVRLAKKSGQSLVGFLREKSFNFYSEEKVEKIHRDG